MGVSTDGEIWFGVLLDEDVELPWELGEDDDWGLDDWWHEHVKGLPPWDYDGGESYAAWEARKASPPVELVNVCSHNCPVWGLAVPGTVRTAGRGYPVAFKPEDLTVPEDAGTALVAFLREYFPDDDWGMPQWHLSSMWG